MPTELIVIVVLIAIVAFMSWRIMELERYVMSAQNPGAYITATMPKVEPPALSSEEVQAQREIKEYGRMIMSGVATPAQIKAHEKRFGKKEDILS